MDDRTPFPAHAVAIVGYAGRFPGARDLDEFWENVRKGVESLQAFSDADLRAAGVVEALRGNPRYVRQGTVLDGADLFDAAFFGLSPREAQIIDPQQRIFLECAWEALENAGYAPGSTPHEVGVYAGSSMNTYLLAHILRNPSLAESVGGYQLMLGNDKDFLCTRVSYKLDLQGPSMAIQTACSTSLVAVEVACRALQRGECDMALAGGVSVSFPQRGGYLYQQGMILSPDGHCRPFDAQAGGIRPGAGCGIVVLRRLAEALADRDTIHAVILGAAVNNDGADKAGYTAPSVGGQVEVIATAQALAGVDPRSIGFVEAHGTATLLGDPIEIAALTQVFRASTADVGFCRLGSLKANLGHLDAAAGVASLIKTVLALKHREFPPLVNFRAPNPQLALERSPFLASASGAAWPAGGTPRRAGVSSFGIGGTNAHVVLEEAPAVEAFVGARDAQLLVLSARSASALEMATARLAAHLQAHPDQPLADVAWTLQSGRKAFGQRRIVVAGDTAQAIALLAEPSRAPAHSGQHDGGARAVAFLFSGQGSQHAGMGAGLYRSERVYREAVDGCAEMLRPHLGLDLREAMFAFGDTTINQTRLAQPALFVTEFALTMLWAQWGVKPAAMLGHSIGEYVAAHLAGVMSLEDALVVVAARGRMMQSLPAGRMAAVHLGADELKRWTDGGGVEIAAVNAPSLCTVSGDDQALTALLYKLGANGIESRPLHTSHAFHSAMMEPVLAPFTELLATVQLKAPTVPYVSNVTGTWITEEEATSPDYYARHLRRTVLFEAGMRTLMTDAATYCLEVGPGNSLATLARMCLGPGGARRALASLGQAREERPEVASVLETAGRLWLAGTPLDWRGLHADAAPRRVPLPTYPFERMRHWVDAAAPGPAPAPADASGSPDLRLRADVADWFFAPTWTRDDSLAGRRPRMVGTWLVLGGAADLSDAVAAEVATAGAHVVRATPAAGFERQGGDRYQVRLAMAEDIAAIASDVREQGRSLAGAIVLWGLVEDTLASPERLLRPYHALVALAAGLEIPAAASVRIVVATAGGQSVLDERLLHSDTAIGLGPLLALPSEVPGLQVRTIDLASGLPLAGTAESAAALVAEAGADDREVVVARRAGRRWVRRFESSPLAPIDPKTLPLKQHGVYLITGGLGGMGLALARELARRVSARLLLTSRRGLLEGDAGAIGAVRDIETAGGEVIVAAADAADLEAMRTAIDRALSKWGAIDGVIHAAGVTGAGRLSFLKSPEEVIAVLAPKAGGLDVLVRLLGAAPLDFVALMSSINSVVGAPGVADYATANALLDAFVESAKCPEPWRRVVALNWGAWRDVGMAAKLVVPAAQRAAWNAYLRTGIGTEAGVDAFLRALASGRRRLVIVPYDLAHAMEQAHHRTITTSLAGATAPAAVTQAPSLSGAASQSRPDLSTDFEPAGSETERQVAAIWTEVLGIDQIGVHDDFFELGGHSLAAIRVLARIETSFGVRLSLRNVFDLPTISRLAGKVAAAAPDGGAGRATRAEDREEIEF